MSHFEIYFPFYAAIIGHIMAGWFAFSAKNRRNRFAQGSFDEHGHKTALLFVLIAILILYGSALLFANVNRFTADYGLFELIYNGSLILSVLIILISFATEIVRRLKELRLKGVFIYSLASVLASVVVSYGLLSFGYVDQVTTAQLCTGAGVCLAVSVTIG